METYTHILQKTGVLKNFTVAKIVKKQEIEELKSLIKSIASNENEYKELLTEELAKISDMHDKNNPIPGIIYSPSEMAKRQSLLTITKKFSQGLKKQNFEKKDLAFLISAIINELGLTQEDFQNLKEQMEEEYGDDDEENEED